MQDYEYAEKLRRSQKFHQEVGKANHEKRDSVDRVLRYGEIINDKDPNAAINQME